MLLTVFTVNTLDQFGDGSTTMSLYDAIEASNFDTAGPNVIDFALPGSGVQTIKPTFPLPKITQPVTIDGYSQPGSVPNTAAQGDNATPLIVIDGSGLSNPTMASGLDVQADNTTIRGLVIDNFATYGVGFVGTNDHLEGSFVGVDPTGKIAAPNGLGVGIFGGSGVVGGATPAARNVISGNLVGVGVASLAIDSSTSMLTATPGDLVQNNLIGTDSTGSGDLGNGFAGVLVGGSNNIIGGTAANQSNVIDFNGKAGAALNLGAGVAVVALSPDAKSSVSLASTGDLISGNSIYANQGQGIGFVNVPTSTLEPVLNNASGVNYPAVITGLLSHLNLGVSPNVHLRPAGGPNNLLNYPSLTSATTSAGVTTILGTLDEAPKTAYTIQYFSSPMAGSNGFGQGQTLLGQASVTTGADGTASLSFSPTAALAKGLSISAVAIDPAGNTSQFSNAVSVVSPVPPALVAIPDQTIPEGGTVSLTALGADADPTAKLVYSASVGTINPTTGAFTYTAPAGPALTPVTITVTDSTNPTLSASKTFTIHVLDVAPTVSAGADASLQAGGMLSRTGSFTDPGIQTFSATVNYGDNSGTVPLALNADKTFTLNHTYSTSGTFKVLVSVTDSGGSAGSAAFQAVVIPKPLQITAPVAAPISKGALKQVVISFGAPVTGAATPSNYHLALLTTKRVRGKIVTNNKPVTIKSVQYDSTADTVAVIPGKKIPAKMTAQLTVNASGILDASGQPIDGNHDGIPGGNLVIKIQKGVATVQ